MIPLLLNLLLATPGLSASSLRYFGWYGDVTSTLDVTGPHSNLVQTGSAADAVIAKAAGQDVRTLSSSLPRATHAQPLSSAG